MPLVLVKPPKPNPPPRKFSVSTKPISKVVLHFPDGGIEEIEIPNEQGFVRKRYSIENGDELEITELFWTKKLMKTNV